MDHLDNDPEAALRARFDAFVRAHWSVVERRVRRRLGKTLRQRLDSQDVLQEAFLEAARLWVADRERPEDDDAFIRWLTAIVENKARSLARYHAAQKRDLEREVRMDSSSEPRHRVTPSAVLQEAERKEKLDRAITLLSPRQREVVQLVHIEKLGIAEAAEQLGKTRNATSVLLYEALKRLGTILGEDEQDL